jgi:protein SCO1
VKTTSAVVLVVFLALAAIAARFAAAPSNPFGPVVAHRVAGDALTSDTGATVRLDTSARSALIVLGYTRCTDACPLALAKVVAAARPLRRDKRPRLYFVTVDPAHDSPAVLHRYLAAWHNEVVGLTGDPQALRRVAASLGAGGVVRAPSDHDTRLFLLDRSGELLNDVPPDIAVDDLRRLLAART